MHLLGLTPTQYIKLSLGLPVLAGAWVFCSRCDAVRFGADLIIIYMEINFSLLHSTKKFIMRGSGILAEE